MESEAERFCVQCGYDLRGIESEKCPECGLTIDRSTDSPIPWEHRKQIGRAKAFWRTLEMAMLRPSRLAQATAKEVDPVSAKRFRMLVLVMAIVPLLVELAVAYERFGLGRVAVNDSVPFRGGSIAIMGWQLGVFWSSGITLMPVLIAGIVLAIVLGTNLAKLALAGSSLSPARRRRAETATLYLCAPLAGMLLPVTAMVFYLTDLFEFTDAQEVVFNLLCSLFVLLPLLYLWNTGRFAGAATHGGPGRMALAVLLTPLAWIWGVIVGLGLLPFIVGFLWIVFDSLR